MHGVSATPFTGSSVDSKDLTPIVEEEEEPTTEQIQADSDAVQEAPKSASAPVPYTPT